MIRRSNRQMKGRVRRPAIQLLRGWASFWRSLAVAGTSDHDDPGEPPPGVKDGAQDLAGTREPCDRSNRALG